MAVLGAPSFGQQNPPEENRDPQIFGGFYFAGWYIVKWFPTELIPRNFWWQFGNEDKIDWFFNRRYNPQPSDRPIDVLAFRYACELLEKWARLPQNSQISLLYKGYLHLNDNWVVTGNIPEELLTLSASESDIFCFLQTFKIMTPEAANAITTTINPENAWDPMDWDNPFDIRKDTQ